MHNMLNMQNMQNMQKLQNWSKQSTPGSIVPLAMFCSDGRIQRAVHWETLAFCSKRTMLNVVFLNN